MQNLKKVISLNKASKISGYTQDYLGFLIRSGELKGEKMGRSWFTTEEEINNYFFKRKVRQNKFAFREFFSKTRTKRIVVFSAIFIMIIFFAICKFEHPNLNSFNQIESTVISDNDAVLID